MRYVRGVCTYCDRTTAMDEQYGRLTCPESEAERCFRRWEAKANTIFDQMLEQRGNDYGK